MKSDKGKVPVTVVPDDMLMETYLSCADDGEDKSLVWLLDYAVRNEKEAAKILRQCLSGGKKLVAVYPGLDDDPPKKGKQIGTIPDGCLYLV